MLHELSKDFLQLMQTKTFIFNLVFVVLHRDYQFVFPDGPEPLCCPFLVIKYELKIRGIEQDNINTA